MSLCHSLSGRVDIVSPMSRSFSFCPEVQLGIMVYDADDLNRIDHGFICACPVDRILGRTVDVGDCCVIYYHFDPVRNFYVVDELVPVM